MALFSVCVICSFLVGLLMWEELMKRGRGTFGSDDFGLFYLCLRAWVRTYVHEKYGMMRLLIEGRGSHGGMTDKYMWTIHEESGHESED